MIVCAVLAAGGSRRLGSPKQLVMHRGKTLVEHAFEAASFLRAAVVVGAHRAAIEALALPCIANEDWEEGMASSVRTAVRWARSAEVDAEALLLHLVDQPFVDRSHLVRLVDEWRATQAPLIGSRYDDVVGAPAIFAASLFDELEALTGDRGAGQLLRQRPDARSIPGPAGAIDVDTPEDVQRLADAASSPKAIPR